MNAQKQKMKAIAAALGHIRAGCMAYGVSLPYAVASSLALYLWGCFSIKEIVGYALYVPEIRRTLPVLISKERSLARLAAMNPRECQALTENKAVFYERCRTAKLPVPETYAVFEAGQGTDGDGNRIEGRDAWVRYFEARLPADFIMKDVGGAYASGFAAFERRGDTFRRSDGDAFDSAGLYEELARRAPGAFILQERLFDHPDLETLSGCRGLQTMRVNTFRDGDAEVSLLFYMIKILVGRNVADNFSMGTTGNLIAVGRTDEGVLEGARTLHSCGSGLATIRVHPETGVAFDGYRIPLWRDAIELARTAHRVFPAFGSLGWDIAITADGPRLIEANAWWDPPTYAPHIMSAENWRRVFG